MPELGPPRTGVGRGRRPGQFSVVFCVRLRWMSLLVTACACLIASSVQESTITVHAKQVVHRVSRHLTGACIEDVNHEVYGGIDSQMIFGESFAEPPPPAPLRGFTAYGGQWLLQDGESSSPAQPKTKRSGASAACCAAFAAAAQRARSP